MSEDIKIGDKVRVSRTVVVDAVYPDQTVISGPCLYAPSAWDIEVIERHGPQVGDTITGSAAYASLPVGAVLDGFGALIREDERLIVRTTDGFYSPANDTHRGAMDYGEPRTLVDLP
jgi:hypothetical protein